MIAPRFLHTEAGLAAVVPVVVGPTSPCCSFCGKDTERVATMIQASRACICDECVEVCERVLHQARRAGRAQMSGTSGVAS